MFTRLIANWFFWIGQGALPLGRTGAKLARLFLNQSIMWSPTHPRARGWLHLIDGVEARDRGDLAASVRSLREAAALIPDSSAVVANLGISLALDGQYDTAVQVIERAIRSETDVTGESQIWVALLWSYLRSGRPPKALEASERAEASRALTPEVRILRLLAHASCRGFVNRDELRDLVAIRVRMLPMVLEYVEQLARNGSRDLARQILDCVPPRVRERSALVLARSSLNRGDLDTALWATKQYESKSPDSPYASAMRAEIAMRRGDLPGALSALIRARSGAPITDPVIAEQLVRVRLVRGDLAEASAPARTSFSRGGKSALSGAIVALDALRAGDSRAARKVFTHTLEGDALGVVTGSAVQALVHAHGHEPEAALRLAASAIEYAGTLPKWARTPGYLGAIYSVLGEALDGAASDAHTPSLSEALGVQRQLISSSRERDGLPTR